MLRWDELIMRPHIPTYGVDGRDALVQREKDIETSYHCLSAKKGKVWEVGFYVYVCLYASCKRKQVWQINKTCINYYFQKGLIIL